MKIDDQRKKIYIYPKDSFKDFEREGLNKGRKKNRIDHRDYKKIVAKFIRIWLFNFLWQKGYYYFPFIGTVAKYKTNNLFVKDLSNRKVAAKNQYKKIEPTVGIFWKIVIGEKNSVCFINKTKGVYTHMFKDWMELNNVNDLLTLNERIEENKNQKKQL